jgi:hypothetical protein
MQVLHVLHRRGMQEVIHRASRTLMFTSAGGLLVSPGPPGHSQGTSRALKGRLHSPGFECSPIIVLEDIDWAIRALAHDTTSECCKHNLSHDGISNRTCESQMFSFALAFAQVLTTRKPRSRFLRILIASHSTLMRLYPDSVILSAAQ